MGEPKALLRLLPGGPTMIERIVSALQTISDDVFLVGEPAWPLPERLSGMRILEDARQGAADGLLAALRGARHDPCLVVACDMPFLDPAWLLAIAGTARERSRSVVVRDESGMLHPLHAAYRLADLREIEALIGTGERSLGRLCTDIGAVPVDTGGSERRQWSVFNVNTPADLDVARSRAGRLKENVGYE